jgi:hypothetical protein
MNSEVPAIRLAFLPKRSRLLANLLAILRIKLELLKYCQCFNHEWNGDAINPYWPTWLR